MRAIMRWRRFTNALNNLRHEAMHDPWNHIAFAGFIVAPFALGFEAHGLALAGLACFVIGALMAARS